MPAQGDTIGIPSLRRAKQCIRLRHRRDSTRLQRQQEAQVRKVLAQAFSGGGHLPGLSSQSQSLGVVLCPLGLKPKHPSHHGKYERCHPARDGNTAAAAVDCRHGQGLRRFVFGPGLVGFGALGRLALHLRLDFEALDPRLLRVAPERFLLDLGLVQPLQAGLDVGVDPFVRSRPGKTLRPEPGVAALNDPRAPGQGAVAIVLVEPAAALLTAAGAVQPFPQIGDIEVLFAQPGLEVLPAADQAFVADVDQVVGLQRLAGGGQHKAHPLGAIRLDHHHQRVLRVVAHLGAQLGQRLRPAHIAAITPLGQGQEKLARDLALEGGQGVVDVAGMVVDGKGQLRLARHAPRLVARRAHSQEVVIVDGAAAAGAGPQPHPQQRVLQHRQFVLAAQRIDQAVGQHRGYAAAHQRQRRGDDRPDLLAAQPRREVDAAVDGLGQAVEGHRIAQEV